MNQDINDQARQIKEIRSRFKDELSKLKAEQIAAICTFVEKVDGKKIAKIKEEIKKL